jgi:hypothetical protein
MVLLERTAVLHKSESQQQISPSAPACDCFSQPFLAHLYKPDPRTTTDWSCALPLAFCNETRHKIILQLR